MRSKINRDLVPFRQGFDYFTICFIGVFWMFGILVANYFPKGNDVIYFNSAVGEWPGTWMKYFTIIGETSVFIICLVLIACFKKWSHLIALSMIGLLAIFISNWTKDYFHEPRPFLYFQLLNWDYTILAEPTAYINKGYSSFPSGHTIDGFLLFGYLSLMVSKIWMKFGLLLLAVLIGISRIFLGQHFMVDIIAGSMIGSYLAGFAYYLVAPKFDHFFFKGESNKYIK